MNEREFVELVAVSNPIEQAEFDDTVNECHYCKAQWAESDYNEYLANHMLMKKNDHHKEDCLWVVANRTLRSNSA